MRKNSDPADKSSAENPPLKDENNADPLTSVEDLYREVKGWHSEHDTWLKDVDQWRREQRLIKLLLYKMERALPDQNNSLDEHTRIIRNHKQRLNTYEKNFQALLAGDNPYIGEHDALLEEHKLQKNLHLRERARHASFRHTHLAAMSELTRLTQTLEQAEKR